MDTGKSLKVYVQVKVDFREDGVMLPREIIWEDGVTYEIDRVVDIRQAAAMKAGGQGDRYTIVVRGKRSYLFFERSTNQTGKCKVSHYRFVVMAYFMAFSDPFSLSDAS